MKNKIFCAVDTPDLDIAKSLASKISPVTGTLKLGLEFFNAQGPQGVQHVHNSNPESDLFLDLKYHDIPNTVAGAIRSITQILQPAYLNVHCAGGMDMMKAARDACPPETKLLGVTILTSLSQGDLQDIGFQGDSSENVVRLAMLAEEAGLDGIVCSAHEIDVIRQTCGPDFELMVPGIRPEGNVADDQKRIKPPLEAINEGATHLVIGRPITRAEDPAAAAQAILDSIA